MESSVRPIPSISLKTTEDQSVRCYRDIRDWIRMVPDEFKETTLESCVDLKPSIIQLGKTWATKIPLMSLYIFGDWGCGKTSFVFAILRYLKEQKHIPWYFCIRYRTGKELDSRLLQASKSEYGDEFEIQDNADQDLLFLDDLDKVNGSARFKNQLFEIINRRKLANRPTIITSNLSPGELESILDGAVVSRMGDETRWKILKFPDGDLRKKKINTKVIQL